MGLHHTNSDMPLGSANWQNLFSFVRMLLFFFILWGFAAYASIHFHNVHPNEVAAQYQQNLSWLYGLWPAFFDIGLVIFAAAFNPYGLRYMLTPLIAGVCAIAGAAYYVMDVYDLQSFWTALHYVLASMFAIGYPKLVIDGGERQLKRNETNLIEEIGGPGFLVVEPGSAAIFRHLRRQSLAVLATTYFIAPFERVAFTIDLEEQQGDADGIRAVTRDGIQIMLGDVHFRYRIQHRRHNGNPVRATIGDPNPIADDALFQTVNGLSVESGGLDRWQVAVERLVVGEIADFIAAHEIDYLTAPRSDGINPRLELKNRIFFRTIQISLARSLGAELLWIDVGHIDIIEPSVDVQRTNLWAADWDGNSREARAYGEARRTAYQELGRAEAQAELIMSISDALREINLSEDSSANIRQLFLARTAQILDSLQSHNQNQNGREA